MPLVVFFNARREVVEPWFAKFGHDELTVVCDPDAAVYNALGTGRLGYVRLLTGAFFGIFKSLREGLVPHPTKADVKRQGADVAVDASGEMVLCHLAAHPDDRRPPSELRAALGA